MRMNHCAWEECKKKNLTSRGFCKTHYEKWMRHTKPEYNLKHNIRARKYREKLGDKYKKSHAAYMRKRIRTKSGYLEHKYRKMRLRTQGKIYNKRIVNNSYIGVPICSQEVFVRWAMKNKEFHRVFQQWLDNQGNPSLYPSIDRIKNELGYVIGNMRFMTHSQNSSRPKQKNIRQK